MAKHKEETISRGDVATMQSGELVPSNFKALSVDAKQLTTFMKDNLGGQGFRLTDLDKIKVPSGGGSTWEVPTLQGNKPYQVLEGIILHFKDVRAYWKEKDGGNKPPDCSSSDSAHGVGDPGGDCQKCPFAQFGSATDDRGNAAGGQACKAMRLFLFLREDDMIPMIVALPPTSLQNAKKYFLRLVANGYPFYGVTTQIRLEQAKNPQGKPYSKAVLNMGRKLEAEEFANAKAIGQAMKDLFDQASQVIDADVAGE